MKRGGSTAGSGWVVGGFCDPPQPASNADSARAKRAVRSIFRFVGEKREMPGALDGASELALVLGRYTGEPRG